jgi:hypothetical protein
MRHINKLAVKITSESGFEAEIRMIPLTFSGISSWHIDKNLKKKFKSFFFSFSFKCLLYNGS